MYDCPTASGKSLYWLESHQPYFAASWDYPMGTRLHVRHTRHALTVEVTDRGPAKRLVNQGRRLDLSKAAFQAVCGDLAQGTCHVTVEAVGR